ncbi:MAG TPA: carboxylating nicotinate-nucleotide diphosphorylase [bacterium]|nr:carboxylating nicotinate-nucleotide diphosphorylase [Dictyoglomota bacterium]HOP55137.1 carboxylating nicotinate-nucleotide diphosphorylase [bacterium]HPC77789.1 carboxylating nicotinate-nucleotide diphosphorylase [bacterium]HRR91223.1 carboxylating nicotinate-nucleotide diphosphorylase [bacterium]HRU32287.1 carboxylating nicotinate-nucleotide diphosphorylase [bacterium]
MNEISKIVMMSLEEDIGIGDITTDLTIDENLRGRARVRCKEKAILCGCEIVKEVFHTIDNSLVLKFLKYDGEEVSPKENVLFIEGKIRSILKGERVSLNFLSHLSGIATVTSNLVKRLPSSIKILDTRKTLPGLRFLEKYAVKVGGGKNHRFGLYDGILIKDNHSIAVGGVKNALELVKRNVPHYMKVEIETATLEDVKEALEGGADVILLDNMDVETIREAIKLIDGRAQIEVSGGINDNNIEQLVDLPVDFISVGAITHSAKSIDFSLTLEETFE